MYAGFDRADSPSLSMMTQLKAETNLVWCGYYLHAPSQPATTWKGQRSQLVKLGWGLAPIYVGQQHIGPGSHNETEQQGSIDGEDAAKQAESEGFILGTYIYLDLENGLPLTQDQKTYVIAWASQLKKLGYGVGIYCSYQMAEQIAELLPDARIWVFHVPTIRSHVVAGKTFDMPDVASSGYAKATIWQRDDEASLTAFGGLMVDLDVSLLPDPGAPDQVSTKPSVAVPTQNVKEITMDTTTAVPTVPVPPAVTPAPTVSQSVTIDWGSWLSQAVAHEAPILESVAESGVSLVLAQVPFGSFVSAFIGPTVIKQYVDQAVTALQGIVGSESSTFTGSLAIAAGNALNANEPKLVAMLEPNVDAMIQAAIAKLKL